MYFSRKRVNANTNEQQAYKVSVVVVQGACRINFHGAEVCNIHMNT